MEQLTSNPIDFDNLIVAHKTGTLLAVNDYYPFGLRWNGQGLPFHKYQFGGKEYEEELNLNTYDFHARQMDPVLGRFWGVDPMSSERVSFSPFNYVQNNPMNRVDPSVMLDQGWFINADGFEEYSTKLNSLQRGQDSEQLNSFDSDQIGDKTTAKTGTTDPKKTPEELAKIEKENSEDNFVTKFFSDQINDLSLVSTTFAVSLINGYSAMINDIVYNGSSSGNGGYYPKGTNLKPLKFNSTDLFYTGSAITRNNSPTQNKELILSTFGLMSGRFNLGVFKEGSFGNWTINQSFSYGSSKILDKVIKVKE